MESRMDKYYKEKPQEFSRSKRNQALYKEVYGSYTDFDYLPMSDNSSEINVDKLREMVSSREEYRKKEEIIDESNEKETDNKIYDINELIEKARSSKPKLVNKKEDIKSYNYLKKLETQEQLKEEIEEEKSTEEIKEQIKSGNTLSLDILSDLKDNTVVVEPIPKQEQEENKEDFNRDIPVTIIIKNDDDKPFYSGSYKFSSKDFFDDDLKKIEKNHSFIKILLIIIILAICITGIYFLVNYLATR